MLSRLAGVRRGDIQLQTKKTLPDETFRGGEAVREYIINESGERTRVILDLAEYRRLVEAAEELEDIAAYDEAKAAIDREGDEAIPLEQAMREIREGRVTGD